jgi:hypothetical protein
MEERQKDDARRSLRHVTRRSTRKVSQLRFAILQILAAAFRHVANRGQ